MIGVLARLLPWVVIFLIWLSLNKALDKIDAKEVKAKSSKFWGKLFFLYGWIFGGSRKITILRWIVSGIIIFFLFRWVAVSISTPF